jgi:folate-binding protein YgfZ
VGHNERILIALDDLGMVRVQGPDTTRFLQGQLSNDVARLTPDRSLLAGYHNPQGRTIALVRLMWLGAEDFLAVLPRELAPTVAARLARFVLRAKVKVTDESSSWRATGLIGADVASDVRALGVTAFAHAGDAPPRWLVISPANTPTPGWPNGERKIWHRLDIEAGQAQVFAATSEQFVAQMLNLDVLDAVSFDKGCYTGQEVIARAHYRGKVKRRLQRFVTRSTYELPPGSAGRLADGRPFKVVDSIGLEDGRCEFLAVAPLSHTEPDPAEAGEATDAVRIETNSLALPYALPG